MDAPGVGLEASQAGQHQDGEDECQHGQAQGGVGDQGQGLQVPLQLLLTEREKLGSALGLRGLAGAALPHAANLSLRAVHQNAEGSQPLTLAADVRGVPVHHHAVPDRPASRQIVPAGKRKNGKTGNENPVLSV